MKKILSALLLMALAVNSFAQKVEVTVQANSGLYHYSGGRAAASSFLIGDGSNGGSYTNNSYGNKNAISYGGALQAQVANSHGFIFGLGAGYEVLRSKIAIDYYYPNNSPFANNAPFPANGRTYLQSNFINLNPYAGYRFNLSKVRLDILPGLDIAFKTSEREHGKATYQTGTVTTNNDKMKVSNDTRLRVGLAAAYGKLGLNVSYAHGLVNQAGTIYADPAAQYTNGGNGSSSGNDYTARGELIRFGISYRVY